MTGEVCHFEIPAANPTRAQKFYAKSFGWKMQEFKGMNYTLLQTAARGKDGLPKEKGVINGGLAKRTKDFPTVTVVLWVEDIKKALVKVRKNGGKPYGEKAEIPGMGWSAYFKDTEGNLIGLFQPASP